MVNKLVFSSSPKTSTRTPSVSPVTDTTNTAGGKAYNTGAKHTLAQIACTGTFNGTFYADGEHTLKLAEQAISELWNDPQYIAKVAIYSREKGFMKDLPAYIVAKLAGIDTKLFRQTFRKVVDNGKMLRNVIQIARSDKLGKKKNLSSGTWRHALRDWFASRDVRQLFHAAIGNDPTMADIIKMSRPRPETSEKGVLYRYLIGKPVNIEELPEPVRSYEIYRKGVDKSEVPSVDFRYLADLGLGTEEWKSVAKNANWTMTRMNLNTFQRHGVFDDKNMVELIANRLRDKSQIEKARVFPYQLFMAYKAASGVPHAITEALQDAMEIAVANTPVFQGQTYVGIDVSGSMTAAVTGNRGSATSSVRCLDAAALYGSAILRNNRSAEIMPFSDHLYPEVKLNGRDSVMTNTKTLSSLRSGGTDCSLVLAELNRKNAKGEVVVYLSDNESWINNNRSFGRGTGMMNEWVIFKKRNPSARLVLIDLAASNNSQVTQHDDILQVGGFSDTVFNVIDTFIRYGHDTDHWVSEISKVSL
jgi:60 kDa SS-A/Ro ribonucleoprotein